MNRLRQLMQQLCQSRCINTISSNIHRVSVTDMKRVLQLHQLTFNEGHTCLQLDCPLCRLTKRPLRSRGKLFINKVTGFHLCNSCQHRGQWDSLELLITSQKPPQRTVNIEPKLETKEKIKAILEDSIPLERLPTSTLSSISVQLGVTDFGLAKLKKYGVLVHSDGRLIFPLLYPDGSIGGLKLVTSDCKEEATYPTGCYLVAGWKSSVKEKSAVLVPSMMDAVALASHTDIPVIGLPCGVKHLPIEFLPLVEHFDRLYLWLGSGNSWGNALTFARKLNERRCHLVRHPESPAGMGHQLKGVTKILESSQPMAHKDITSFSNIREEVFQEFSHAEKAAGVKWTRFPGLNRILKGHRRGELTVFTGPTGAGKTTFISDYSLDLCMQGVNTLWGSFELPMVRLAKIMLTQFAEENLERNLSEFDRWADHFERLPMYFMTYHGQQSIGSVLEAMSHAVYVYDIAHIIVDNLQFMIGTPDSPSKHMDRFWQQDAAVAHFRKFATSRNCHVTLVIHPRKERETEELLTSSIFGSAKASQEADNVLILQDKKQDTVQIKGRKYLQVTKNRYSGDLGYVALDFNRESLSFATRKFKEKAAKVSTVEV